MSDRLILQGIILKKESTFTFSEIVNEARSEMKSLAASVLDQEIRSIMSTYIKNGIIGINQEGYQICSYK